MNIFVSIAFCFIPLIAFFICLILLSKHFNFFKGLFACLIGLFSVVPIAAIQFVLDANHLFSATSLGAVLLESIILNGLIEEAIKMGLLFLVPHKKVQLSEFFCYSLLCGLSVGCFESVIYLISGYEHVGLRLITAVIIHLACTGLGGLFVYSIKNKSVIQGLKITPFMLAVVIHGIYNYFAGFSGPIKYFSFGVILFALIECRICYKRLSEPAQDAPSEMPYF